MFGKRFREDFSEKIQPERSASPKNRACGARKTTSLHKHYVLNFEDKSIFGEFAQKILHRI